MKKKILLYSGFVALLAGASGAWAQPPLTVQDSRGVKVVFPNGTRSFADRVVSFKKGTPWTSKVSAQDATKALGIPDYKSVEQGDYLTLGNRGMLTLEFTDNYLVNVPGPDLWVFEVGPLVESTNVAISKDGTNWIHVGQIAGGTAGIDIGPKVREGDRFSFVRLMDTGDNNSSAWPGADIDAVGAIGSVVREAASTPAPKPPTTVSEETNKDCTNFLRIEMKDGTSILVDLRKVSRMIPVKG